MVHPLKKSINIEMYNKWWLNDTTSTHPVKLDYANIPNKGKKIDNLSCNAAEELYDDNILILQSSHQL